MSYNGQNQKKSGMSTGIMITIIILFILFFIVLLGTFIVCSQTRNLTNEFNTLNTVPTSSSSTFTDINISGYLETPDIVSVGASITTLNTEVTSLNTTVTSAATNILNSSLSDISMNSLIVTSTSNLNSINDTGGIITPVNITAANIIASGTITASELAIGNTLNITASKINIDTSFLTGNGLQFGLAGTPFTCMQFGSVINGSSDTNGTPFVTFTTIFPENIVPIIIVNIYGPNTNTGDIVIILSVTSSGFQYAMRNANSTTQVNGNAFFWYLAIG
jgi:hypothetical protein